MSQKISPKAISLLQGENWAPWTSSEDFMYVQFQISQMVSVKKISGKNPPLRVRVRVRVSSGLWLGLGSGGFFRGDFFLQPSQISEEHSEYPSRDSVTWMKFSFSFSKYVFLPENCLRLWWKYSHQLIHLRIKRKKRLVRFLKQWPGKNCT